MLLELSQSGGIANLSRRIVIKDGLLSVRNRSKVTGKRELGPQEGKHIRKLVESLKDARPKSYYGRGTTSDSMRSVLAIRDKKERTTVEVLFDPADPPPVEYNAILEFLGRLLASLG